MPTAAKRSLGNAKMNLIFHVGKLIIIAAFTNLYAGIAYADYGQRAIEVVCNTKENRLEVRPFIMWNEDLEQFMQNHPSGVDKNVDGITQVFDRFNPNFIYQCTLKKSKYQISIDFNTLDISLNDQAIIRKEIDYVWVAYGELYKLELKSDRKWSECSGGDVGTVLPPLTCVPLTKSKTTDCDDVIGHCIKSPNPSFKGDALKRAP